MKRKSGSNWQNARLGFKRKNKVRLALFVLGAILLTLLAGNTLRLVNKLFAPLGSSFEKKDYHWDGKSNLNLVYKNKENISLFIVNPGEKKITGLEIPSNTFMDIPGGFGSWELRSIYDLGGEDKSKGSKLVKNSISLFFSLPIDGFLESEEYEAAEIFTGLNKNPFTFLYWIGRINSDLTPVELIRLYVFVLQVRVDKVEIFDLKELNLLKKTSLHDGGSVYLANDSLDSFVGENLYDSNIKTEQKTIAIFNGTNTPGLAQKFARLINNMGGNVIISDNTGEKYEYSIVYGEESATKKRLSQIFNSKYAILSSKPASRAQITIILGEDLAQ